MTKTSTACLLLLFCHITSSDTTGLHKTTLEVDNDDKKQISQMTEVSIQEFISTEESTISTSQSNSTTQSFNQKDMKTTVTNITAITSTKSKAITSTDTSKQSTSLSKPESKPTISSKLNNATPSNKPSRKQADPGQVVALALVLPVVGIVLMSVLYSLWYKRVHRYRSWHHVHLQEESATFENPVYFQMDDVGEAPKFLDL